MKEIVDSSRNVNNFEVKSSEIISFGNHQNQQWHVLRESNAAVPVTIKPLVSDQNNKPFQYRKPKVVDLMQNKKDILVDDKSIRSEESSEEEYMP